MKNAHNTGPGAYGILAVPPSTPNAMVCGTCGKAWADDVTPAGRCPWEWDHSADVDPADCEHEPDWRAATTEYTDGQLFLDVPCKHCGLSGCTGSFTASDVSWE